MALGCRPVEDHVEPPRTSEPSSSPRSSAEARVRGVMAKFGRGINKPKVRNLPSIQRSGNRGTPMVPGSTAGHATGSQMVQLVFQASHPLFCRHHRAHAPNRASGAVVEELRMGVVGTAARQWFRVACPGTLQRLGRHNWEIRVRIQHQNPPPKVAQKWQPVCFDPDDPRMAALRHTRHLPGPGQRPWCAETL